jgi:hypothetical protein
MKTTTTTTTTTTAADTTTTAATIIPASTPNKNIKNTQFFYVCACQ